MTIPPSPTPSPWRPSHPCAAFVAAESFQLEQLTRGAKHGPVHESVPAGPKALVAGLICAKPEKRMTASEVLERTWVREAHREETSVSATGEASAAPASEPAKDEGAGLLGWMFGSSS